MSSPQSLSSYDKEEVAKLRDSLGDILLSTSANYTDFDFLRWLQGFNYNHQVIVPLLKEHLKIYKLWNLQNTYAEGEDPISNKFYPKGLLGPADKNNCLLYIEAIGRLDTAGLWQSANWLTILRSRICTSELCLRMIRQTEAATGKQAWIIFIQDLDGMSWDWDTLYSMVAGPYKWMGDYWAQHYVEKFKKIILINAPSVIYYLWAVIRKWVPAKTRDKVIILGHNYQEELLKIADPQNLPKHWGGNRVDEDGDEMCRSMVTIPTPIPKDLYWRPTSAHPAPEDMIVLALSPGKTEFVTRSAEAESGISWHFTCDSNFTFGVFFTPTDTNDPEDMEPVYPTFHNLTATVAVPEYNQIECTRTGFYKIMFANSNNWFGRLTVRYCVKMF